MKSTNTAYKVSKMVRIVAFSVCIATAVVAMTTIMFKTEQLVPSATVLAQDATLSVDEGQSEKRSQNLRKPTKQED